MISFRYLFILLFIGALVPYSHLQAQDPEEEGEIFWDEEEEYDIEEDEFEDEEDNIGVEFERVCCDDDDDEGDGRNVISRRNTLKIISTVCCGAYHSAVAFVHDH